MTPDEVDAVMAKVQPDWRERWCESSLCACMGCANSSGGARAAGVTREDWEAWKMRNPVTAMERQGDADRRQTPGGWRADEQREEATHG